MRLIVVCLVVAAIALCKGQVKNGTRLSNMLLQGYSRNTLPEPNGGLEVEFSLALGQFVSISTALETVEFQGWWRMYWTDERLSWDQALWGVSAISFEPTQVWQPDLAVYEHISDVASPAMITCYPDGSCQTSVPRKTKIGCSMNIQAFPYDSQKCNFTVGSWSFDGTRLDVVPRKPSAVSDILQDGELPDRVPVDLEPYKGFQEFSLVAVKTVWMNEYYNCCPEPYPVFLIEFDLQRSTQTYIGGMVAPLLLVTFIGFFSLLMPAPPSGARPALSVTIMLTTATVYFVASRATPQSNQSTIIGRMYVAALGTSFVLVFVSILTTALNLIQAEDASQTKHLVEYFKQFDANGDGSLDKQEFRRALRELGLSADEQELMMKWFMMDTDPTINVEQWKAFSTLTEKGDDSAVYHNFVVKKLVRRAIEAKLKHAGQWVGREHPLVARIEHKLDSDKASTDKETRAKPKHAPHPSSTHGAMEPVARLSFPTASSSLAWNSPPPPFGMAAGAMGGVGAVSGVWANGGHFGAGDWQPPRNQIRSIQRPGPEEETRSWEAASGVEYSFDQEHEPSWHRPRGAEGGGMFPYSSESLGEVTRKVSRLLNEHMVVQSNPQRVGRELASKVDRLARWVLPLFFALYLALEYAGAFSGEAVSGELHKDSEGNVKTRVEFFDYRTNGEDSLLCYRNFPKTKTSTNVFRAAEKQCNAPG